ncbi:hypothetical protein [Streptomyces anulatus]|uniref:hypothetical protein n=1 Tax=Streptomyces anulatus TaxID=1892 RepID=UPI0037DC59CA|nr:hypothetical protein OHB50_39500 [Streptomyces anulatus]
MTVRPTYAYEVISVPEGTEGRVFRSSAPAGSVVTFVVGGRPRRVLLTDTPLYSGRRAAEIHEYL